MQFPSDLFKAAGLNSTDVAELCGVSRVTGYRWLSGVSRQGTKGVGVNVFLQDRVAKIAGAVHKAVDARVLPNPAVTQMPPEKRVAKLRSILKIRGPK